MLDPISLETPSGVKNLSFKRREQIGLIIGSSGSGKTIASLKISEQLLSKGNSVYYFSGVEININNSPYMAEKIIINLQKTFPNQFHFINGDTFTSKMVNELAKNCLIIVDETYYFYKNKESADNLNKCITEGVSTILCGQTEHELLKHLPDASESHLNPLISFMLIGRGSDYALTNGTLDELKCKNKVPIYYTLNAGKFYLLQKNNSILAKNDPEIIDFIN